MLLTHWIFTYIYFWRCVFSYESETCTASYFLVSVLMLNQSILEGVETFGAHRNVVWVTFLNTLRPRQNGRHLPDDIFKCIFVNGNIWISIKISLKIVPEVLINNIPALVQIMAWRRPGDKPLSEPMLVSLLTHICVTRPQWVNVVSCKSKTTAECYKKTKCCFCMNCSIVTNEREPLWKFLFIP